MTSELDIFGILVHLDAVCVRFNSHNHRRKNFLFQLWM